MTASDLRSLPQTLCLLDTRDGTIQSRQVLSGFRVRPDCRVRQKPCRPHNLIGSRHVRLCIDSTLSTPCGRSLQGASHQEGASNFSSHHAVHASEVEGCLLPVLSSLLARHALRHCDTKVCQLICGAFACRSGHTWVTAWFFAFSDLLGTTVDVPSSSCGKQRRANCPLSQCPSREPTPARSSVDERLTTCEAFRSYFWFKTLRCWVCQLFFHLTGSINCGRFLVAKECRLNEAERS